MFTWNIKKLALLLLIIVILAFWALILWMPGSSYPDLKAEQTDEELEIAKVLERRVRGLSENLGNRSFNNYPELEKAALFVEQEFVSAGYQFQRQEYEISEGMPKVWNIEVEIRGQKTPEEIIVIGAHYDGVEPNCPAANDNGSGVASLLTLADRLQGFKPDKTIRLVAFVNEEPPFFQTEKMGSLVYARRSKKRGENIVGMLSLETMGYYDSTPGSQSYPLPLSLFFPDTGNFIGFISNIRSGTFLRKVVSSFRKHAKMPSEGVSAPEFVPGISWSDQWAFWKQEYPAVMVTDTAPFRYPHYHLNSDTWEKIDYGVLARLSLGLEQVTRDLSVSN